MKIFAISPLSSSDLSDAEREQDGPSRGSHHGLSSAHWGLFLCSSRREEALISNPHSAIRIPHSNQSLVTSAATSVAGLLTVFIICGCCHVGFAAEIDESKLPPPAQQPVDFDRDIRPIFETSCWRCHGAERPKSRFSLVSRETALKGGDNGVDILPGQSGKSPLIHNVAHLVEDMEMPPPGKGEALTPQQIGLLRAWIDQGAKWSQK